MSSKTLGGGGGSAVGVVKFLQGNSGGAVGPDNTGVINLIGSGNITVSGNAGTFTETITLTGTTNHAIQLGNASGSLTSLGVATNGQIPIGSTGADPVLSTITAGSGISVTNGAGSITIANTNPSGSLVLLQTQTASSSSSIVFNSTYITNTYKTYFIKLSNIVGVTGVNMDFSTNNGSTYVTNNNAGFLSNNWNSAALTNGSSTATCTLFNSVNTKYDVSATLYIHGLAGTYNGSVGGGPTYNGTGMTAFNNYTFYGVNTNNLNINAIKFTPLTGTFTAGTFSLYGVTQ